MTLEQVARTAVEELWAEAEREVDPPTMLAELRQTRRRRRVGWLAATAAAVTVVLTIIAVGASWPSRTAVAPARSPLPSTEVLLVQERRSSGSVAGIARLKGIGGDLPHLPRPSEDPDLRIEHRQFWGVAFSPDGSRLAYGDSLSVGVMDLATGKERQLRACRYCVVAWMPTGEVLSVKGDEAALYSTNPTTGRTSRLRLPAQWRATSIDVSSTGRVLLGGLVDGTAAVMTFDVARRTPAVLATYPGARVHEPRWSPDGDSIAFLHKRGGWDETVSAPLEIRVTASDGSGERVLATPSTCTCERASPHLDWADSGRMAVVAVRGVMTSSLVEVAPDGTMGEAIDDVIGPIAWRSATTSPLETPAPARRTTTTVAQPLTAPRHTAGLYIG